MTTSIATNITATVSISTAATARVDHVNHNHERNKQKLK